MIFMPLWSKCLFFCFPKDAQRQAGNWTLQNMAYMLWREANSVNLFHVNMTAAGLLTTGRKTSCRLTVTEMLQNKNHSNTPALDQLWADFITGLIIPVLINWWQVLRFDSTAALLLDTWVFWDSADVSWTHDATETFCRASQESR